MQKIKRKKLHQESDAITVQHLFLKEIDAVFPVDIFCHLCLFSSASLQQSYMNLSISADICQRENYSSTDYCFFQTFSNYTCSNWTDRKVEFWKKVWQCLTMRWNNRILTKLHFLDKSDKVDMVADFIASFCQNTFEKKKTPKQTS